ncbi:hypothetical protein GL263_13315 [Streptomyces durbertensis]|uniref:Uncharacterized protein n=1 Tax=Streptomyces durbertensis TaxID=2448886 RepID=A0ABR6EGT5_9ACTN|nr:hypothetical protein [Streptomyces durbertensis]MBB1244536.1 hypothetical protein [Streptomyces durbertensis]
MAIVKNKFIVATAVVVIFAIGAGGFLLWRGGQEGPQSKKLCWGSISVEDVEGVVGISKASVVGREIALTRDGWQQCNVRIGSDRTLAFTISIDGITQNWPYAHRYLYDRQTIYGTALPIGGDLSGWVSERNAGVWLPDSCAEKFNTGDHPVALHLSFEQSYEQRGDVNALRKLMVNLAVATAERAGCSEEGYGSYANRLKRSEFREVPEGKECGLRRLAIRRSASQSQSIVNYIAGDLGSTWSCLLAVEGERGSEDPVTMTAFTLTGASQVLEDYKKRTAGSLVSVGSRESWGEWVYPKNAGSVIMRCQGREVLMAMEYPYEQTDDKLKIASQRATSQYLKKPRSIFNSFVASVSSRLDCRPVSP